MKGAAIRPRLFPALLSLGALWGFGAGQEGQAAQARPVMIGNVVQAAAVSTRFLGGQEMLAVWTLPRLGVQVRNDPQDLRLRLGTRELRYAPTTGWQATGWPASGLSLNGPLPAPQLVDGSLYAPLAALKLLGVSVRRDVPELLAFAAPASVPTETLPPSEGSPAGTGGSVGRQSVGASVSPARVLELAPPPRPGGAAPVPAPSLPGPAPVAAPPGPSVPVPGPAPAPSVAQSLVTVRVNRELRRTVELQRVVLELSAQASYQVERLPDGLSVRLPGVGAAPSQERLPSGDTLEIAADSAGTRVTLRTKGGRSEVFALENPARVVVDTVTYLNGTVPPPIDPEGLPEGVTYRQVGLVQLLSFDPARFQARVVSAPHGQSAQVAALVRSVGGAAGVNASYFDPISSLPVDLVVTGGLMTAPSLERRGTVGFTAAGQWLFGYPKPRYRLTGPFGTVQVNSVGARPRPELLTAFVGDGRSAVGDAGLVTLHVGVHVGGGAATVQAVQTGRHVPPAGILALTFDPARFPALPRQVGAPLTVTLDWNGDGPAWGAAREALSAGPMLVRAGQVVIDAGRERFDTGAGVWRPTRQVALGLLGGQPTLAYFEYGTPEGFAAALAGLGFSDALRLDSGSSATAFVEGGYAGLGGYLNSVWSRPVPNAVVFVPKSANATK